MAEHSKKRRLEPTESEDTDQEWPEFFDIDMGWSQGNSGAPTSVDSFREGVPSETTTSIASSSEAGVDYGTDSSRQAVSFDNSGEDFQEHLRSVIADVTGVPSTGLAGPSESSRSELADLPDLPFQNPMRIINVNLLMAYCGKTDIRPFPEYNIWVDGQAAEYLTQELASSLSKKLYDMIFKVEFLIRHYNLSLPSQESQLDADKFIVYKMLAFLYAGRGEFEYHKSLTIKDDDQKTYFITTATTYNERPLFNKDVREFVYNPPNFSFRNGFLPKKKEANRLLINCFYSGNPKNALNMLAYKPMTSEKKFDITRLVSDIFITPRSERKDKASSILGDKGTYEECKTNPFIFDEHLKSFIKTRHFTFAHLDLLIPMEHESILRDLAITDLNLAKGVLRVILSK